MSMLNRPDKFGYGAWNTAAVGTNAGVTATHTKTSGSQKCYVSGISGSGDAAALVTVESPSGTPIWRKRFAAAFTFSENFVIPLGGATSQDVLVKISASTSNSEANISGYDI